MPEVDPQLAARIRSRSRFWTDPDAFATTLLLVYWDAFGGQDDGDPLDWDVETVRLEIRDTFGVLPGRLNLDRLMMALLLRKQASFYSEVPAFIEGCNVLAGTPLDPTVFDPADALEVAWGVTEAMLIAPSPEEEPFSADVRAYIGAVLDAEGIMQPPDVLRIAIRDDNYLSARVQADFADDHEMFSAIYKAEAEKSREIDEQIRKNLLVLLAQLESLGLERGDAARTARQLARAIGREDEDE